MLSSSCIIFKNCTVFLKFLIRYWILNYLIILFLSQIHKITAPIFHAWYKLSSHTQLGFLFQFILYSSIKDNLIDWIVISYLFASEIDMFLMSPSWWNRCCMVVMSYFVSSACLLFHSCPRLKRGSICITAYLAYKRFSNSNIGYKSLDRDY